MDTISEEKYLKTSGTKKQIHHIACKMLYFVRLFLKDELSIDEEQIYKTNLLNYMKIAQSNYYNELYIKKTIIKIY